MNSVKARIRYDADSHIMETPDWLSNYAEAGLRGRFADLCPASMRAAMDESLQIADLRKNEPVLRQWAEADPFAAKGWAALGAVYPEERTHALDLMNFGAQLVFSTYSINQFLYSTEPDVRVGGARAHNRGMVDFCKSDRRLLPVGVVPLDDGPTASQLAGEAIDDGCAAIWIPPVTPTRSSPSHPDFDSFWAKLQDSDVPFVLHVGTDGGQIDSVYHNNGRPLAADILGGTDNMRSKDYMVLPHFPATTLAVLILDGVLDHFPLLRGACIEYGAAWVPSWIDRLDRTYSFFRKTEEELARLGRKPSEYVAEQIKFTPDSSERVASLTEELGPGLLMFSTDFPHFEGGEDPIGAFEEGLNGIPEEAKAQFYETNFAQLVGLDKFTV